MLIVWIKSKIYFHPNQETCFIDQIHGNSFAIQMGSYLNMNNIEDIIVNREYGYIHGWILRSEKYQSGGGDQKIDLNLSERTLIVVSHGNAGSIVNRNSLIHELGSQFEADIVIYDYSGYGSTTSNHWVLTEDIVQQDCQLVVENLIKQGYQKKNIILYGESIGVPITCKTASKMLIDKVILQSGPASISDVSEDLIPQSFNWLIKLFINNDFSTKSYLQKLKKEKNDSKVILLHSRSDEIVSYRNAKILEKYGGILIDIEGTHNNPIIYSSVWKKVKNILS